MASSRTATQILSATLGAIGIAFALSATAAAQSADSVVKEPERTNSLRNPSQSNTESGIAEDRAITERVQAALDSQPDLRTAMLRVQTSNRQVLLTGGVETTAQRDLAIQVASSVQGVGGVQDGITLKQPQA
jgi:osmotically-inducible protein OsmY